MCILRLYYAKIVTALGIDLAWNWEYIYQQFLFLSPGVVTIVT